MISEKAALSVGPITRFPSKNKGLGFIRVPWFLIVGFLIRRPPEQKGQKGTTAEASQIPKNSGHETYNGLL